MDDDARPGAWRSGFVAGVLAAALATALMLALRLLADVPTLPELIEDRATTWLPPGVFGAFVGSLGAAAKPLGYAALFLAQLAAGGMTGASLAGGERRRARPRPASLGRMALEGLVVGAVLAAAAVVFLRPTAAAAGRLAAVVAPLIVFGLALAFCRWWLAPVGGYALPAGRRAGAHLAGAATLSPQARRRQLERLAWSGLAVAGGLALWRFGRVPRALEGMGSTPGSRGSRPGDDGLYPEVTPNRDFYTVSKNVRDPVVRAAEWRLHISGEVRKAVALTYEQLRDLPHLEHWQTLLCISNPVGGAFASNALWAGVPLPELLALTGGPTPKAERIVLRAADGYSDSLPIQKALERTTLLATAMNGEPLPPAHGFPARLLAPGSYGLKNVKWITAIDVVEGGFRGYWQQRGWTETGVVKTTSRIDFPRRGAIGAADAVRIAGIAFAGDRGVARVEVSDDGGESWRTAALRPPKGQFTWVFWDLPWRPRPGEYQLLVRATDGRGALQRSATVPALPDGAEGYHQVNVRVV